MRSGLALLAAAALTLAACGDDPSSRPGVGGAADAPPRDAPAPSGAERPSGERREGVAGTVVRFAVGADAVDVTVGADTPATRDFVGMLPLTLTLEEFDRREKIAELPRPLAHEGSPGSYPEDGDLIYFVPWGNIGFYYDAEGIGRADDTLHLGTYEATPEQLERLEGRPVTVEVAG